MFEPRRDDERSNLWPSLEAILREHGFDSLFGILEDLVGGIARRGTQGKAPDLGKIVGPGGHVNAIPSSLHGTCARELMVLCYNADNLDERLREMIYHAGIYCRGHNRKVLFLTSKWMTTSFAKHTAALECLRRDGVDFVFALVGPTGVSEISV